MAKKKQIENNFDESYAFYEQLWQFYQVNRRKIRSRYKDLTKKFLAYNETTLTQKAFLRKPQFDALEMYVFIKEFTDNAQMADIFDEWRHKKGRFDESSFYSVDREGAQSLFATPAEEQSQKIFEELQKYRESYPNYIYALTMGLGKTILMATCIFYDFLMARKYPNDTRYCHNALIFAPDKTVLESLKEIITFDKTKVVPPEYASVLTQSIRPHFMSDDTTVLTVQDDSDFNVIISNTQKIIVKKKHTEEGAADALFGSGSLYEDMFTEEDKELLNDEAIIENQRFKKICRLNQLGVFVDEAHHLFGADLEKQIRADKVKKTSLRDTINMLAEKVSLVACYNYTGTPYVKNQVLPEVVYAYGLKESIVNCYLKSASLKQFTNIKSEDFVNHVVEMFWKDYGGKVYEDLNPKIAFFAATVEEAVNELRPMVETALVARGISTDKVLVNVGDEKYTKDDDIRNFNSLDVPGSVGNEKQFIILVGKGREGWNCRSLFGVAMFRSPKSKVFVLQATMRCLRKITEEQQVASVFLSEENYATLDAELHKNCNMGIKDLTNTSPEKRSYRVRVIPPERIVKLQHVRHDYIVEEIPYTKPLDFGLKDTDVSKYKVTVKEDDLATRKTTTTVIESEKLSRTVYSYYTLTAEIARYMNISPILVSKILAECIDNRKDKDTVLKFVNDYNDIIFDVIVKCIFNSMYKISSKEIVEEYSAVLLHTPKGKEFYEFSALPELVVRSSDINNDGTYHAKSFHADTYCFDSKPEKILFKNYLSSEMISEVYFTGMFTAGQGDLVVQYYDPGSGRVRSYYPDFIAWRKDGTVELIEVKGDNKLEDESVKAKAEAAEELARISNMEYRLIPSSKIVGGKIDYEGTIG